MKTFMYMNDEVIGTFVIYLIVFFVVFMILREFFCWYYKINKGIKLLQELNANIKILVKLQGGEPAVEVVEEK